MEKLLVRFEVELAADVIELGLLGGLQAHVGGLEIGAGIDPPAIQPKAVKIIGNVVVILDVAAVLAAGVAPPLPPFRTGFRLAIAGIAQAVAEGEDVANIALEVEISLDIGTRQGAQTRIGERLETGWLVQPYPHQ